MPASASTPALIMRPKPESLQVLIINRPHVSRRLLNLEQLLALCNAHVPGVGTAQRTNCEAIEFQSERFLEDLALLQRTDVLVRLINELIDSVPVPQDSGLEMSGPRVRLDASVDTDF